MRGAFLEALDIRTMDRMERTIALITGANKGIGYEVARRLGRHGMTVLVGARDEARGSAAVEQLRAAGTRAELVPLDVNDSASIADASAQIEHRFGRLDVLVNNAGVHVEPTQAPPSQVTSSILRTTYETNVFAVVDVINAMLPLLRRSDAGRIVNVSSTMGSMTLWSDADSANRRFYPLFLAYNSSKAALNAITVQYAVELLESGIKVNAASPGFVATDLNDHRGILQLEDEPSVSAVVEMATLPADGPTGGFYDADGPAAW